MAHGSGERPRFKAVILYARIRSLRPPGRGGKPARIRSVSKRACCVAPFLFLARLNDRIRAYKITASNRGRSPLPWATSQNRGGRPKKPKVPLFPPFFSPVNFYTARGLLSCACNVGICSSYVYSCTLARRMAGISFRTSYVRKRYTQHGGERGIFFIDVTMSTP